jgi:hypothetical protein
VRGEGRKTEVDDGERFISTLTRQIWRETDRHIFEKVMVVKLDVDDTQRWLERGRKKELAGHKRKIIEGWGGGG